MKPRIKTVLSVVVFAMAASLTYLGVTYWPNRQPQTTRADDTIAGLDGLAEGDVVVLPEIKTLGGEPAALDGVKTEKFLFVFFTPACTGCSLDAALWKSLKEESAKRSTTFYLVNVGRDRAALSKFIAAYDLGNLPVLISEGRSLAQVFRVNIVPQYLLIEKGGRVLHRWDGVRRYEQPPAAEELAKFFQ